MIWVIPSLIVESFPQEYQADNKHQNYNTYRLNQ